MAMTTEKALAITRAIHTLADALGETDTQVAQRLAFLDQRRIDILTEAITLQHAYIDAGVVERGRMLGIEITEHADGSFSSEAHL